jgi:hypothetical protein
MFKFIKMMFVAAFAVMAFSVVTPTVSAAPYVSWNTFPNDCRTVMVGNYNDPIGTDSPCWPSNISAQPGETVNVRIYYHNTGNAAAGNTIISLNRPQGARNSFTFVGIVSGGQAQASGQATITLPSTQTLTVSRVAIFRDQTTIPAYVSNPEAIFDGGLSIGTIYPPYPAGLPETCPVHNAFCHQGSVVVSFKVGNDVPPAPATCAITSFSASPTSVASGSSSNISWSTNGCTNVSVSGPGVSSTQLNGSVSTGALTSNATYTINASNATGSAQPRSATVSVNTASTCAISSFTASPNTVTSGSSSTLSWNTTNCTSVSISGGSISGGHGVSGSISTGALTASTTYTLTAFGSNGQSVQLPVTVTVPAPAVFCTINSFSASPEYVVVGSSSTLYWSTSNCSTVVVSGGNLGSIPTTASSINTGAIYGTTTFTITATGSNGQSTQRTVLVSTTSNPTSSCTIDTFYASPSTVVAGSSATLYWSTSGCTSVSLSGGSIAGSYYGLTSTVTTGAIYGTQNFTLTAFGSNGQSTQRTTTVTANAVNQCLVSNVYALPSSVESGGSATLYWSSTAGAVTVVGGNLSNVYQYGTSLSTGPLYQTTTFTITPMNCGGGYAQSQSITVYVTSTPVSASATTTFATNVVQSSARLNGLASVSGNTSATAYFEYGTTASLGLQTAAQNVSPNGSVNYFNTINTSPNTTYFYRAVVNVNGQIYRGGVISFTTPTANTYVPPVVNTEITYGVGTGSSLVSLSINDQFQSVSPGDILNYVVNYKNISVLTLSNATLNVVLPEGTTFRQSTTGMYTTSNTVIVPIGTLIRGQEGIVNIQVSVNQNVNPGSTLVATATLTSTTPAKAQDTAIAYDADTVYVNQNGNNFGAFAFGAGFFPTTLLGWILLIGLIILIIVIARYYNNRTYIRTNGPMQ